MTPFQTLGILVVIILIVWWALRRSTAESGKETPVSHDHVEHEPAEHEHAEHEEHGEPVVETMPEKAPVVVPAAAFAPEPMPIPETEPIVVPTSEPVPAPVVEAMPDNLVLIEGIGPRISGILKTAGIVTFAQLAVMDPEQIKALLVAADERLGRIADPATWPQQADLAAKGELEALQQMQDSLKAGRKA